MVYGEREFEDPDHSLCPVVSVIACLQQVTTAVACPVREITLHLGNWSPVLPGGENRISTWTRNRRWGFVRRQCCSSGTPASAPPMYRLRFGSSLDYS